MSPQDREYQQIEWKESWREDYFKWICGFANAQGGDLIIGKGDQGQLVGLENAPWLLENLPNQVRDLLGIMVEVNLRVEQGLDLIEIRTPPYPNPISYKGSFYQRIGSTNQLLNGPALQRFLLQKQGIRWDSVTVPQARFEDLDPSAFKRFRELARRAKRLEDEALQLDNHALLDKLRLLEDGQLKRAAVLLFHPEPDRFVTGCQIKLGYFSHEPDEVVYQDEIQGPLMLQIDRAMESLRLKFLRGWISYEGIQRVETYPVPLEALREALLNAVIHKDYASCTPIQMRIYDDQIRLFNNGYLPDNWTVDKLLGVHGSQPYNPDIAHCFFRAGQIESWGQGVSKIFKLCQEDGLPNPHYDIDGSSFMLHFTAHKPPSGASVGGLFLEASQNTQSLETKAQKYAESEHVNPKSNRVNEETDRVNEKSNRVKPDLNESTEAARAAFKEAQEKSYSIFKSKPINEKIEFSDRIIEEAVKKFGIEEFLALETGDIEAEKRFVQIYERLQQNRQPDEFVLMRKATMYFEKKYAHHFKKQDYSQHVKKFLEALCLQEGLKTPFYAERLGLAESTIARYVKTLKDLDIIEFVGAPKTGGYFLSDRFKEKIEQEHVLKWMRLS